MEAAITSRQRDLLAFLTGYIGTHGFSPSYQQMTDALGLHSKSGTARLVEGLIAQGCVRRTAGRARSLEVVRRGNGTDAETLRLAIAAIAAALVEARARSIGDPAPLILERLLAAGIALHRSN